MSVLPARNITRPRRSPTESTERRLGSRRQHEPGIVGLGLQFHDRQGDDQLRGTRPVVPLEFDVGHRTREVHPVDYQATRPAVQLQSNLTGYSCSDLSLQQQGFRRRERQGEGRR